MRVLVTGATGFIGKHLVAELATRGHAVTAAVREPSRAGGFPESVRTAPVPDLEAPHRWDSVLASIDVVVHAAGMARPPDRRSLTPEHQLMAVNCKGGAALAMAAARCRVRRFINISSAKVHGESTPGRPFREEDAPMPEDAYARSKLAGEMAMAEATHGSSMQIVTIRPPLVYGPGMDGHFAQLMNMVHRGLPLPLANVNNRRSLIYVGNLADAIARCVEDSRAAGRTFLVSDDTLSTPELIHRLAKAMSRPARLFPFPAGLLRMTASAVGAGPKLSRLVDSLQVDSNMIRNTLEWRPPYTTAAGLSATVAHWQRHSQSTTHK